MRELVVKLIEGLGETLGLPALALNEDGCCCISFDGIPVNFEHQANDDDLLLSAKVAEAPSEPNQRFIAEVLDLSYGAILMSGGCLGIDKTNGLVIFADRIPLRGLDQAIFEKELEIYVDRAEGWGKLLAGPQFARLTAQGPDLAEVAGMMRSERRSNLV